MKTIKQLLAKSEYNLVGGNIDKEVSGIAYDSRKCGPGYLFVAVKGFAADGHDFIGKAVENGAKTIICENVSDQNTDATLIQVKDSRKTLAEISHAWYNYPSEKMKVIGVTGTNGKTTVTYLIKSIFEAAGRKTGLIGTTGILFGGIEKTATHTTPESLELCGILNEMSVEGIDTVVMEVSSHALSQRRVYGIDLAGAVFTNLTQDHLDYHNTPEEYAAAKKILFDMLPENAKAVVNADDSFSGFMILDCRAEKIISVGRNDLSDMKIENQKLEFSRAGFTLKGMSESLNLIINIPGKFNVDNAASAAAVSLLMGIDKDTIERGIFDAKGAKGRMDSQRLSNGALGIIDYAHTPDALKKALLACREIISPGKKLICVFGCGGDRDKTKRPLMGEISTAIADYTIITDDNPRTEKPEEIIKDIVEGIDISSDKWEAVVGRSTAITKAHELSNDGDIILIAGKGHEEYQIIGTEKSPFSDFNEINKFS